MSAVSFLLIMQTHEIKPLGPLQNGQLWKIEHGFEYGYLYIVELGNRLIHYRMLRQPDQKAALTKMIGLEALVNYLRQSEAELVS